MIHKFQYINFEIGANMPINNCHTLQSIAGVFPLSPVNYAIDVDSHSNLISKEMFLMLLHNLKKREVCENFDTLLPLFVVIIVAI